MNVCVFGLWHLGCVTAAGLADLGLNVIGLDFDKIIIDNLNKGKSPIFEPDLNEIIQTNVQKNKLSFTYDKRKALNNSDYIWITFDTPVDNGDNADVEYIKNQFNLIIDNIKDNTKIIISSQVPAGFTKKIEDLYKKKYPSKKIYFAYSPENLRLGKAIKVFKSPDRIIIGIRNKDEIPEFGPIFSRITNKLEWMKIESAEMTKHAINSFLATSVVFANEIASICESVGADAHEVSRGLKTEERIGPKAYLNPGLSFAGGTLARDINFLIDISKKNNKKSILLKSVKQSNQNHKNWIKDICIEKIQNLNNVKFTLLGLTYKSNTDTLRRSSAIELAKWLCKNGGIVSAFDPQIKILPKTFSKIINLKNSVIEAIKDSDCIIISQEHTVFRELQEDFKSYKDYKLVIDPTSFLENIFVNIPSIKYISVGRG